MCALVWVCLWMYNIKYCAMCLFVGFKKTSIPLVVLLTFRKMSHATNVTTDINIEPP